MKNMKTFNEAVENRIEDSKVISIDYFGDNNARNLFKSFRKKGFTPFYINDHYDFVEILISKEGNAYIVKDKVVTNEYGRILSNTQKVYLKGNEKSISRIYMMSEDDLTELTPVLSKIKEIIDKMEQKKKLLIELVGSKLSERK